MGAIENYVIGILEEILGEPAKREQRFAWAVGDPSLKTGRSVRLPFDAVWESHSRIVEVDEDQHHRAVEFFDKPDIPTVSGVPRGEQRALYDRRKRAAAREQGYTVIEIAWERRPPPERRNRDADRRALAEVLRAAGVEFRQSGDE